ncbi:hypothetical protein SO802_010327 [Lithocarpus litseifolius]|uniref:Transmembrane protein n=1 Tax=Lithocarpus litseifolius TaxID=425828 RepID=A0AAW2DHS9_9ROSI
MNLENTVKDHMASPLCCFRNPLPWFAVLAPLLISAAILVFGFSSILLTSTVLIFSTIYFTFSKHKPAAAEKLVQEKVQMEDVKPEPQPHSETITLKKEAQEEGNSQIDDHLVTSFDSLSESECLYHLSTSEESEVEWPFHDNVDDQSPDYSDGSISDEESLIEIALPSGQYVGHKEELPKVNNYKQQIKLPDFSPESIFQQRCLMELISEINEMNEEENLIEIDISMGSIKCSRFEIEA